MAEEEHIVDVIIPRNNIRKIDNEHGDEENGEEIELSLGLSLNGRFGVDPKTKELKRSSSISNYITSARFPWGEAVGLTRTCSLPVVAEEESRKRKEAETLRRSESKRKLSEKVACVERVNKSCTPPPLCQGSSGSSGVSDFESHTTPPGMDKGIEAKSPQSVQSFSEKNEHKSVLPNPEVNMSRSMSGTCQMVKTVLEDMPCVSTKGDGPKGKKLDGFLYRYKKGEEVRIVCVCHGNFLTPAEFIKHAGGNDVEHPLRHIVVNPSPFL